MEYCRHDARHLLCVGLTSDGVNPQVSAYSSGVITITQVSISTTGTQTVNIDSGATGQYVGAAFRFQQVAGTADTITAITISETSASFNANTNELKRDYPI